MNTDANTFSKEQWNFLGTLHTLKEPIPLDVVTKLSPIMLESYLHLVGRNRSQAMIRETNAGLVSLAADIPQNVSAYLQNICETESFLSSLADRLINLDLLESVPKAPAARLLTRANR
jgi:hypothetical protein